MRKVSQRLDDALLIFAQSYLVLDGRLIVFRQVVAEGDETTTVVVSRQVEDDRAQVRRRLGGILDAVRAAGQPDEGFLHEIFCRVAVVDEQTRQPDE